MHLAYQYKLLPTKAQRRAMEAVLESQVHSDSDLRVCSIL